MFEAVIFDFDGVILDSEPIHYEACCNIFKNIGLTLSYTEYLEKYIGLSDKEMFPQILNNKGYRFSSAEINLFINQKIEDYTHLINAREHLPIVSAVDQYIDKIVKEMKKIAICTGSTRKEISTVLKKLHHGKLQPYFNTIVTADDVQYGKPSPEGYLLTAKQLNVSPDKCLVIEDAPHGIKAAKQAGMYVIALSTTHSKNQLQEANQTANNFIDLLSE